MTESYCPKSPDGKHKRTMLKSGLNPEYGCIYCWTPIEPKHTCPKCGHSF